jgi:hypothetical protein
MDDITERLRDVAKSSPIGWDLMPKAADEIDRLRAALDGVEPFVAALRAERDALQERLALAREWIAMVRESVALGGEVVTFTESERSRMDALLAALEGPK